MNKVQLYEDLGRVLYLLSDYIAEESEQYVDNPKMRNVFERAFDDIADIYENLEATGELYIPEYHVKAV